MTRSARPLTVKALTAKAPTAKALAAAVLVALPALAQAQSVTDCASLTLDAIAEPWEQNTASYADGAIRIARLDLIEPAGAPFALVVLAPPLDEVGGRSCYEITDQGGAGFGNLDFAARTSAYDPSTGLELRFPVESLDPAAAKLAPATLSVTIDQAKGTVTARTTRP